MEIQSPKKTFETMNGLRGLAAILVVVWHGGSDWYGSLVPSSGYLAVDLFFVLSGFVIAHSYEGRLSGDMTTRQFFLIRLVRLYPLYFLGTVTTCAGALAWSLVHGEIGYNLGVAIRTIPFAVAMLPAPSWISGHYRSDLYPLNVPAWSLFCEIVINLVYAASHRFWSPRNIVILMSISAALMLSNDWFAVKQGWGGGGFNWASMPFGLFRVFYSFPAGVLIYRIVYEKHFPLPRVGSLAIFAIFPLLFFWPSDWSRKLIVFLGFPMLVALGSFSEPVGVRRRLCASLGSASYAIYALHFPLIGLIVTVQGKYGFDPSSKYIGGLFLASIVPLSLLVDKWFDNPKRSALGSRFVSPSYRKGDQLPVRL